MTDKMSSGTKVQTKYGAGIILGQEGKEGILSKRYKIRLDNTKEWEWLHAKYGGICIWRNEIYTGEERGII